MIITPRNFSQAKKDKCNRAQSLRDPFRNGEAARATWAQARRRVPQQDA